MSAAQGPVNDDDVPLGEIDRTGLIADHSLERGRRGDAMHLNFPRPSTLAKAPREIAGQFSDRSFLTE